MNTTARDAYRVETGEVGLSLADPTAMAVALDRSIGLSWSRHRVAIESGSELTRGMTVVDRLNVHHDFQQRPCLARRGRRARGRRCALNPPLAPVQGYAEGGARGLLTERGRRDQRSRLQVSRAAENWTEAGRNLLGQETSPYLLQHAGNPVHRRPWSADALPEARRRHCPTGSRSATRPATGAT